MFASGRVISVEGITEGHAKRIFLRHLRIVSDIGISAKYTNYNIRNIVATYDLKRKLDLAAIASHRRLEFEPELFKKQN